MKSTLLEFAVNQKAGALTASSSLFAWLASAIGWIDGNMVRLSASAAFVLTIVMIVAHMCSTIRQNRESRSRSIRDELEIELLRMKLKKEREDNDR